MLCQLRRVVKLLTVSFIISFPLLLRMANKFNLFLSNRSRTVLSFANFSRNSFQCFKTIPLKILFDVRCFPPVAEKILP